MLAGLGKRVGHLANRAAEDFRNLLLVLALAVREHEQHLFVFGQALEGEHARQARVESARIASLPADALVIGGARGSEGGWGDTQWLAMVSLRPRSRR